MKQEEILLRKRALRKSSLANALSLSHELEKLKKSIIIGLEKLRGL